jgi:hypothetical protein
MEEFPLALGRPPKPASPQRCSLTRVLPLQLVQAPFSSTAFLFSMQGTQLFLLQQLQQVRMLTRIRP